MKLRGLLFTSLFASALAMPVSAKTLIYCSEASPETFNPLLGTADSTMDASARTIFDRLVEFRPGTTEVVPGLAEQWTVSDDGMTYTFKLRKGVKFQSNEDFAPTRDFNADDVLYTFSRQRDKNDPYYALGGGRYEYFSASGLGNIISSIEKVDDHTVRFKIASPDVTFLANLAMSYLSMLSLEQAKKYIGDGNPARIDQAPVGTGPFQLVAYQQDAAIRYRAFDGYWNGKPKIDDLVFAITPDASTRTQKMLAGECDVSTLPLQADIPILRGKDSIELQHLVAQNIGVVGFNVERAELKDVRVRRALSMAINRPEIVKAVYGDAGTPARGFVPIEQLGSVAADLPDPNSYDPDAARALLKEAGIDGSLALKIWAMPVSRPYNPNARRMAEMIQSDWNAIGVKAEIVSYEWGEYLQRTAGGEHDVYLLGGTTDNGDPDNLLSYMLSCSSVSGGSNRSRWCNMDFQALLDKGRTTQDKDERVKIYHQAQEIIDKELPLLSVASSMVFVPVNKRVTGYKIDPFNRHIFTSVDVSE